MFGGRVASHSALAVTVISENSTFGAVFCLIGTVADLAEAGFVSVYYGMMFLVALLTLIAAPAWALIPLRLVAEIQLPTRTVTWDVQHVEDSTSFGWAALTNGETVWGWDSQGEDSLIALAVDTIYFKTDTEAEVDQLLFPRTEFNPYYSDLGWRELRLLSLPNARGLFAVAQMINGHNESYDQYFYLFHLSSDSVFMRRQTWSIGYDAALWLNRIEVWPRLPQSAEVMMFFQYEVNHIIHAGWDEVQYLTDSRLYRLSDFSVSSTPGLQVGFYERSDSLQYAFFTGGSRYIYGWEGTPPYWESSYTIGVCSPAAPNETVVLDSFDQRGGVVSQSDFDDVRRVLYSTGDCYSVSTGEVVFEQQSLADTVLAAYVRFAPGEDFLAFQSNRFDVYDGRTGEFVDSTTQIQGIPVKRLVGVGFDELLTFDNLTKIARIYKPYVLQLTIIPAENGQLSLRWTEVPRAVSYRLDRSRDSAFDEFVSLCVAPSQHTVAFYPEASVEFFRVTPLFE